jgi:phosphoenolpyruvate carboxylase
VAETIPEELKDLVRYSLDLLGQAILLEYGKDSFNRIESIRIKYKETRNADLPKALKTNSEILNILSKLSPNERFQTAHAFAVSLEIINACENAYRSTRLRKKAHDYPKNFEERITYVLTAHPTESRSPECIATMTEIGSLLIKIIENKKEYRKEFLHLLIVALKTPVSRSNKPEVKDEADYIYSTALRKDLLLSMIENLQEKRTVFLRTWVGGDKDGHPGINAKVMQQSLQASRKYLLAFTIELLDEVQKDILRIALNSDIQKLKQKAQGLQKRAAMLSLLKRNDGLKVKTFKRDLDNFSKLYKATLHIEAPALSKVQSLCTLFPGLVVPLELRENSDLIKEAVKKKSLAIVGMLQKIKELSHGTDATYYARALVISSTETAQDVLNAHLLTKKHLGKQAIPLVPLFESRSSLQNSEKILEELFQNKEILQRCHKEWSSHFEVMLGYSDSAKENGSLLSRSLIREALYGIEKLLISKKIAPIFFHGSGGSVARGGGSLEEQVSWWPLSSRKIFKVTLQGEMVYRSFSTPEIFNSQVSKILSNSQSAQENKVIHTQKELLDFAVKVSSKYQALVFNEEFLKVVEKTTPYTYLNELKIGSRPTKRIQSLGVESLRAIPWVLCWTQIRSLLPIWWGIGSTWKELSSKEKMLLKDAFNNDSFFSSFVKLLAFSLAKVNLAIWFSYLQNSTLEAKLILKYQNIFQSEFNSCIEFIQELSGEQNILWFRPWLEKSIKLRSTMIHPLNMSQIIALKNNETPLLRESVTGIASGMLTTG